MLAMILSSVLYVTIGCPYCHRAEQDLDKACISYTQNTSNNPFNVAPVLSINNKYYIGLDQIDEYVKTHDNCK